MKTTDPKQQPPRVYHVGTKTHCFDALGKDLLVTAFEENVGEAGVEELTGMDGPRSPRLQPLEPTSRQGNGKKGYLAFQANSDAVYRIQGVEYVPVHRVRYVRFDRNIGFRELTRDEAMAILAKRDAASHDHQKQRPLPDDPSTWPDLTGKADDVRRAEQVRLRVRDMLSREAPELLPQLLWHKFARWYLRYEDQDVDGWRIALNTRKAETDEEAG